MTIAEQITRAKADYDEVYQAGKKAEYDAFWDNFQQNGNRTTYRYAFYSQGNNVWKDNLYNPKYPITCTVNYGGDSIYQSSLITDTKVDIIITSTNNSYTFLECANLTTIRKIIVSENTTFNRWFDGCRALETLVIEGTIAQNGLNLKWSTKLSKASITSVINALSTTTSGLAVTLSKTAVDTAFETSEGANDGSTSTEWTTLIATKSNWTISLV